MNFPEFKELYQKKEVQSIDNLKNQLPLISVCVQTFQHKDFIKDCLNGILKQETDFPFEILIGEDDSSDGTRETCLDFARKHPSQIKLFLHHRENQIKVLGEPTGNFNALYNLFAAKGKYIAVCEGDDFWVDPLKLQKQVNFLESHQETVFAYHAYDCIDQVNNESVLLEETEQPKKDLTSEEILQGEFHPLLLTLCFRNILNEIPGEMTQVINVDTFLLSLLGKYGKGKYLPTVKPAKYRMHHGGTWSKRARTKKILSKILTFQKMSLYYFNQQEFRLAETYREKKNNHFKMLLMSIIKNKDFLLLPKILRVIKKS